MDNDPAPLTPRDDADRQDAAAETAGGALGKAQALLDRVLVWVDQTARDGAAISAALAAEVESRAKDAPAEELERLASGQAKAARAVHRAAAVLLKVMSDLKRQEREQAADAEAARARAAARRPEEEWRRKQLVGRIVWRVASDKYEDDESCSRAQREAVGRLDADDLFGDVVARPVSELVAELSRDLSLTPDWPELAKESWARDEIASGRPGAPLAALCPAGAGDERDVSLGSIPAAGDGPAESPAPPDIGPQPAPP